MSAWMAWEHYVFNLLRVFYHPVGRIFLRWRRKLKYYKLRDFIRNYTEVLWRKVEARQVSNSLRIACSSDYTLCFFDVINFSRKIEEWDEQLRLPMYLIARGEGSFFNPYKIDNGDLMVQLLAFHIEKIHSLMLFRFWEEVNCIIRCIHLRQPFPDLKAVELEQFTELCDRYNNGFFQFNGLEVVPCIYSAPIFVKQGKYVPFVLPKSANSQQLERKSAYMQLLLERSNKVYTYKPGLIVTATSPMDSFSNKPQSFLSFHWAPVMLRESDEITVRRFGVQVAHEPEALPKVTDWYLSGVFFQKPRFNPYIVLFVMVLLILWDFFTTCLLLLRYITEPSMHIELLFILIMPFASIIAPILGMIVLFLKRLNRYYVSFTLVSFVNYTFALIFEIFKSEGQWLFFTASIFIVKLVTIYFVCIHCAHMAKPLSKINLVRSESYEWNEENSNII